MGRDGKTGETLVKSVLAPLFAMRNLRVLSWIGHNMLGNRDGQTLRDPASREAKIQSKDHALDPILGYRPDTHTTIDYVASLGDRKLAWDFIHFEGFLGSKMTLQFTWHASDSLLAAPLILDLVRFAELHHRRGGTGPMKHLACFFKSPMDHREQNLFRQHEHLVRQIVTPDATDT